MSATSQPMENQENVSQDEIEAFVKGRITHYQLLRAYYQELLNYWRFLGTETIAEPKLRHIFNIFNLKDDAALLHLEVTILNNEVYDFTADSNSLYTNSDDYRQYLLHCFTDRAKNAERKIMKSDMLICGWSSVDLTDKDTIQLVKPLLQMDPVSLRAYEERSNFNQKRLFTSNLQFFDKNATKDGITEFSQNGPYMVKTGDKEICHINANYFDADPPLSFEEFVAIQGCSTAKSSSSLCMVTDELTEMSVSEKKDNQELPYLLAEPGPQIVEIQEKKLSAKREKTQLPIDYKFRVPELFLKKNPEFRSTIPVNWPREIKERQKDARKKCYQKIQEWAKWRQFVWGKAKVEKEPEEPQVSVNKKEDHWRFINRRVDEFVRRISSGEINPISEESTSRGIMSSSSSSSVEKIPAKTNVVSSCLPMLSTSSSNSRSSAEFEDDFDSYKARLYAYGWHKASIARTATLSNWESLYDGFATTHGLTTSRKRQAVAIATRIRPLLIQLFRKRQVYRFVEYLDSLDVQKLEKREMCAFLFMMELLNVDDAYDIVEELLDLLIRKRGEDRIALAAEQQKAKNEEAEKMDTFGGCANFDTRSFDSL